MLGTPRLEALPMPAAPGRQSLEAVAVRLLDQWAHETDPANADAAIDGRPRSAWIDVRIGVAQHARAGGAGGPGITAAGTSSRAPRGSRPPPGALDGRLSRESRLVDGLMALVAYFGAEYPRALWAMHLAGSERAAVELLGIGRSVLRRHYEVGRILFMRELADTLPGWRAEQQARAELRAALRVATGVA